MFHPTLEEFIKLSKEGNLIPIYKEIVADMETPVSAYKKIEGDNSFLLESIEGGENIARYSFLGSNPLKILKFSEDRDPFPEIKKFMAQFKPVKLPPAVWQAPWTSRAVNAFSPPPCSDRSRVRQFPGCSCGA